MKHPAWGKADTASGRYHALTHHSMDVAAVFLRMLQLPVIRDRLNAAAGAILPPSTRLRLAALVFLHDIGKLQPGFQAKGWPSGLWSGPRLGHVEQGYAFFRLASRWADHPFHATLTQIIAWGDAVESLLEVVLAHHGQPLSSRVDQDPSRTSWKEVPHYSWREEAVIVDRALRRWFAEAFTGRDEPLPDEPQAHHLVAGLVALADWIGSDQCFFPFSGPFDPNYDVTAHSQAKRALLAIGFASDRFADRPEPGFSRITGYPTPRPAQAAVGAVAHDAKLLVLEAETGSGKTEAAVALCAPSRG